MAMGLQPHLCKSNTPTILPRQNDTLNSLLWYYLAATIRIVLWCISSIMRCHVLDAMMNSSTTNLVLSFCFSASSKCNSNIGQCRWFLTRSFHLWKGVTNELGSRCKIVSKTVLEKGSHWTASVSVIISFYSSTIIKLVRPPRIQLYYYSCTRLILLMLTLLHSRVLRQKLLLL